MTDLYKKPESVNRAIASRVAVGCQSIEVEHEPSMKTPHRTSAARCSFPRRIFEIGFAADALVGVVGNSVRSAHPVS
jgi:hypothetical protein